ncbi:uncharacterized protein LOC105173267 [Sesamum indicum]|uniref:Uncharacterized protein LOC105173267 n=1 Tax=Sesamum indicum TaxID=4182 RepID=A0A6I9U7H8_SESIN|nr:uncharacterized protein LOC105173267 [Sesamum indicum]
MSKLDKCALQQIPRCENDRPNTLSKFGVIMSGIKDRRVTVMTRETVAIKEISEVQLVDEAKSWKEEIVRYLRDGVLPEDPIFAKWMKFKATRFTLVADQLYKRTVDGSLLKCLDDEKANYVIREIHEGSCGNQSRGRSLAQKLMRQGYIWPAMAKDTMEFVKKCESCQKYASLMHLSATPMELIKVASPSNQ